MTHLTTPSVTHKAMMKTMLGLIIFMLQSGDRVPSWDCSAVISLHFDFVQKATLSTIMMTHVCDNDAILNNTHFNNTAAIEFVSN